mgnify:CR=1 FL=1
MKTKMVAELKGVLLTHALHQLIPQIETNKHYRVRIEEIDSDKLTMQGNDLGIVRDVEVAAENLGREWDRLSHINNQGAVFSGEAKSSWDDMQDKIISPIVDIVDHLVKP